MTEPAVEAPSPPIAMSPPSNGASSAPLRILGALLVLSLLVAAGILGWQWWQQRGQLAQQLGAHALDLQRMTQQIGELQAQLGETATMQSDLARVSDRNGTEIAALQSRIDDSLALMSRISEDLSGGRRQFQLSSVEQLLVLANDRLLLQRDVKSALLALDHADARLAQLSDPQLFAVREALARERTALRAIPQPDLASAALTLSSLIERIPRLPLGSHAPAQFKSPGARESAAIDNSPSGWSRLVETVKAALQSLFTIRREENARALRVLPPEAEAVVYMVLTLKLEGARVALLTHNTVALREELRSANAWLGTEFKSDDPGVLAVRAELDRLQNLDLTPPLPDISSSLALLRERLEARPESRTESRRETQPSLKLDAQLGAPGAETPGP